MRRNCRVDSNQNEIVAALRKRGAVVLLTHQLKNCFDILVAYNKQLHIVEIKDGSKSASARKLTKGEQAFKEQVEAVGVRYNVVYSVDDALALLK